MVTSHIIIPHIITYQNQESDTGTMCVCIVLRQLTPCVALLATTVIKL